MASKIRGLPQAQFLCENGLPLANGKIYTYLPGTSAPKAVYQNAAGTVEHDNPVILDAEGRAEIWWDGVYDVTVLDQFDALIWTNTFYGENDLPSISGTGDVFNGSFENGVTIPDSWNISLFSNGTYELDDTEAAHGARSIKFISFGGGGGMAESVYFKTYPGEELVVEWLMKSTVVNVLNVVEIVWYDRVLGFLSFDTLYSNETTNPTDWDEKGGMVQAPALATYAVIRLTGCHNTSIIAGTTWFDGVHIDHMSEATDENKGHVELATDAEITAGTDTERVIPPVGWANLRASAGDVLAGTDPVKHIPPDALQSKPGTWNKISETELSSDAEVVFSGIDGTYNEYQIRLRNVKLDLAGFIIAMQIAHSGTTWETTSYDYSKTFGRAGVAAIEHWFSGAGAGAPAVNISWYMTQVVAAPPIDAGLSGDINFFEPSRTGIKNRFWWEEVSTANAAALHYLEMSRGGGNHRTLLPIVAVRIFCTTTMASGTIGFYGRNN